MLLVGSDIYWIHKQLT